MIFGLIFVRFLNALKDQIKRARGLGSLFENFNKITGISNEKLFLLFLFKLVDLPMQ